MNRRVVLLFASLISVAIVSPGKAAPKAAQKAAPAPGEMSLETYVERFLAFQPGSTVTTAPATQTLPGFNAFHIKRKGKYEKLNVDRTMYVSTDGKWFFGGDAMQNESARPVRSNADLDWIGEKISGIFHTNVRVQLSPEKDAAGLKGVTVWARDRLRAGATPGYVSADGKTFYQGTLWDFHMDPRAERRRRIDLSTGRATGPADAKINIVEYADMECGYCKYRGLQMDQLLEANAGIVNVRRHYKFFPLWMGHVWSMKAASAADCLFKFAGPAMFRFKKQVYSRQETMTLTGIDELALATAEAEGVLLGRFPLLLSAR